MEKHNNRKLEEVSADPGDLGHLAQQLKKTATRTIYLSPTEDFQRHALRALAGCVERLEVQDGVLNMVLGKYSIPGGWGRPYPNVNVPEFDEKKQKACVLTLQSTDIKMIRRRKAQEQPHRSLQALNDAIMSGIGEHVSAAKTGEELTLSGDDMQLDHIDLLFKYDLHSHFSYHEDPRHEKPSPVVTVVVKLTADETSMHVAGADADATSKEVGDAHVLLSEMCVPQVREQHVGHSPGGLVLQQEEGKAGRA
jgi:hypothetical protein